MANKNTLTHDSQVSEVSLNYYQTSAYLKYGTSYLPLSTMYCCLGSVTPWTDDNNPPQPVLSQQEIKKVFNNMFVAKRITSNNVSPVIQRIDWIKNNVYDYYQDTIDMFQVDSNGNLILQFYVKNRYDQVFKCLWNNNDKPSLYEPYFQPGAYGTDNIFIGQDGYKWKYIYTIDVGAKINFMDTNWIPVPVNFNISNNGLVYNSTIGSGDIEVINVTNGGSGYDPTNSAITITVTGDGFGVNASAVVSNTQITDIRVTSTGSNFTYANVSISSANGSGAIAIAPVSPSSGHGFNPISELGCSHMMITTEFDGADINSIVPTDIEYYQLSLLVNPIAKSTNPNYANSAIYNTTTGIVVSQGIGLPFINGETVQQINNTTGTVIFSGIVLDFNTSSNLMRLINTVGTPTLNGLIQGLTSKASRTILTVSNPDFIKFTGNITYIENHSGIIRSVDGIEQFRCVLGW